MKKTSGLAIASLIFGILSILFFWFPLIGFIFPILAFTCGAISLISISKNSKLKGKGINIAGIVLGIIGLFIAIIVVIIIFSLPDGDLDSNDSITKVETDLETESEEETAESVIITAPDTNEVLFNLDNIKETEGDCSKVKSLGAYGVVISENCKGVVSYDVSNYCQLGNRVGENSNYYYCRPARQIKCTEIDSNGVVEDVNYYTYTRVLSCENGTEQLFDIIVE
ncbi:DUF4190 domain-containing protein [archaeon]|mgnify:CR=1 FL=1|jgi:hypothetical protein|nr:DUF4190 domain-containing protein [archaeon]MBT4396656.1 DUF4190 domain-containing protein [archaeon]MBT4441266.1 DUF4190 domain-containing protein [archaeon]